MKHFLNEDFLLQNEAAKILYHDYAETMPIFDYHNHLIPGQIAEDINFENLSQIWFDGDHYKWRLMRALGIDEELITGSATDYEKYQAWARTVPYTLGNCFYHWTHMELKNPFGITNRLFGPDTAPEIWEETKSMLQQEDFSVCNIIRRMNVRVMCTTDDPVDSLDQHALIRERHPDFLVVPTFRPDKALAVESVEQWNAYRVKLEAAAGMKIGSFEDFVHALDIRHQFFYSMGSRATDHALLSPYAEEYTRDEVERIVAMLLNNEALSTKQALQFKTAALYEIGRMNNRRGCIMQLHMGAMRNTNTRRFRELGPDTGFNSMADYVIAEPLARFLDLLDQTDELPKTILYTLNQNQNDILAAMTGNFMDSRTRGKLQFGAPWWFNDQKDGIERHLLSIANMGLMAVYIGMLTDSRWVFSFIRHEYYRRILCNLIGKWITDGEFPRDMPHVGSIVQDICYNNAAEYFGIQPPE